MTDVHALAKKGIKLMMGRQVLLQLLTFAGGVILARVLGPALFGLYAIASFLVSAFALFGDFGLASSLIQRKEDLTEIDLRVAFTLQQAVTTVIVILLLVLAPYLAKFYPKAPPETVWLVRALAFNLYLTSWRTMSALQLERNLKYDRLAKVEVIESLTYQGTAVVLALTRHGVWSYVFAVLASSIIGTTLLYSAAPWSVSLGFDKETAHRLIKTGIPFQLQMIINSLGDWTTPLLVGRMIGPAAVGYIVWASSNGKKPLVLVSNIVRVSFPHFSRIQNDKAEVLRVLERYFSYILIAGGIWLTLIVTAGPLIVRFVYTNRWTPAVPSLMLFAFALCFDMICWLSTSTLNALGLTNFANKVYLVRSIANITLAVALVLCFGFIGIAIASLFTVAGSAIWLLEGLGPGTAQRILLDLKWLLLPIVVGIVLGIAATRLPMPMICHIFVTSIFALAGYGVILWYTMPVDLRGSIIGRLHLPLPRP